MHLKRPYIKNPTQGVMPNSSLCVSFCLTSLCWWDVLPGIEAAWHLDRIKVRNSATSETVVFKCRAWLDATSGDGRIERNFYPLVDCTYKVELQTSDLLGAGTSANAVISLIGKLAEAGPIQLANSGDSFQRGGLDVMTLDDLPDIGPIQQVPNASLLEVTCNRARVQSATLHAL